MGSGKWESDWTFSPGEKPKGIEAQEGSFHTEFDQEITDVADAIIAKKIQPFLEYRWHSLQGEGYEKGLEQSLAFLRSHREDLDAVGSIADLVEAQESQDDNLSLVALENFRDIRMQEHLGDVRSDIAEKLENPAISTTQKMRDPKQEAFDSAQKDLRALIGALPLKMKNERLLAIPPKLQRPAA